MERQLLKVSFNACGIGLNVRDASMEAEYAQKHGMDEKRVRATKKILTGIIEPVNSEVSKIRRFLKECTFEGIGSTRLMVASEADRIQRTVENHIRIARQAIDQIAENLEDLIEEEKEGLGDRYDRDNYPSSGEAFKMAFDFSLQVEPMPSPSSFQLIKELTEVERERLATRLEQQISSARHRMESETIAKTLSLIKDVSDTLGDPKKKITDSDGRKGCVPRLREHLERLPRINISNNPQLEALRADALRSLDLTSETLRTDAGTRSRTAFMAGNLHNKYNSSFGGRAIVA